MEIAIDPVQESEELKIPDRLPLLPVRDVVVYPYMILPLFVGREMSVSAVDKSLSGDRLIFRVAGIICDSKISFLSA